MPHFEQAMLCLLWLANTTLLTKVNSGKMKNLFKNLERYLYGLSIRKGFFDQAVNLKLLREKVDRVD